jgi:hypothetical protein
MADLLIHYSIIGGDNSSRTYIFPPNVGGPGGITPLHLAACASGSDGLVDALTNDPHEVMFLSLVFFPSSSLHQDVPVSGLQGSTSALSHL